ncbi:MAG TPA: sugar porter family MFS transporter [Lentisphaeria bacterium]|nr:MAG: MFS transporter [Lentisphaerae bacterium GWF2_38_69]HBM16785.1 sugar porter family MFS transporter [Lentisphaeria bacterium]
MPTGKTNSQPPVHEGSFKGIVYVICIIAATGGLLFGLDQGFIANSLDTIDGVYKLGVKGGENYAAVLAWGGILGALLSGLFARLLGRKKSLVMAGFLFSACSVGSALLPPIGVLTVLRFLLGFAVGVASFIVPLYLSETAPAKIRGAMGTLFQLLITIGIFLIALTNVFIARLVENPQVALPLMFLVIALFALVMFFGSFILPESPRWLMLKGRKEQAIRNLQRTLSTQEEVDFEIKEIETTLSAGKSVGGIILKGYFIKILIVGVVLQMFQQLVGINMMIYYAPTIFGYASMTGIVAMMTVPVVNMLFTFPAIKLVEKWGRKKLLYVGAICMLVTMVAAGLSFHTIGTATDPSQVSSGAKAVLLISVIVYIFGFAVSWGPVAWLVCSEIFPLEGREVGMTVTTMVNWTFAGLVMANALSFMKAFGNSSIFYLFGAFCILAIIFVKFFVPETRGVTLEKIEADLRAGKPLRSLGLD